jgi:hypothetical protein
VTNTDAVKLTVDLGSDTLDPNPLSATPGALDFTLATAAAIGVPTLGQWTLVLLALLLGISAMAMSRRER